MSKECMIARAAGVYLPCIMNCGKICRRHFGGGGGALNPQFSLDFADAGSGRVDIFPTYGEVAPTYTGATAKTTILRSGLVASVASGTARSYYDPTSLAYLGYLAEGARTNLLLQSEDFSSVSWTKTDTTITADNTTAPDGTATADLFTEGTAGTSNVAQTVTATADVNYAISVFVKRGNTDWYRFAVSSGANAAIGWFNLGTGVVGSTAVGGTGAVVSSSMKSHPNSWYRITLVGSVGSGATAITVSGQSVSADGGTIRVNNATRFMWGAGFENNVSFASSYIPTTVATVTRNADILNYPVTWLNAAQGTLFSSFTQLGANGITLNGNLFTLSAATYTAPSGYLLRLASSTSMNAGGNAAAVTLAGTYPVGTAVKTAAIYQGTAMNVAAQGVLGVELATCDFTGVGTTKANIGTLQSDSNQPFFGAISRIAYYNRRLSNEMLQYLTQ